MMKIIVVYLKFAIACSGGMATPKNTAVYLGKGLTLDCQVSNEYNFECWSYKSSAATLKEPVCIYSNRGRFNNEFRHFGVYSSSNGSVVLYTNATKLEDAGVYACEMETLGKTVQYRAEVIVIKSEPHCSTNLTQTENRSVIPSNNIWMQCTVEFAGNWAPNMTWRQIFVNAGRNINGKSNSTFHGDYSLTRSDSTLTTALEINLDIKHQNSYFECEIYFETKNALGNMEIATNIPEFSYIWKTPVIHFMTTTETETDIVTWRFMVNTTDVKPDSVPSNNTTEWSVTTVALVVVVTVLLVVVALSCAYGIHIRRRLKDQAEGKQHEIIGQYDFIANTTDGYEAIDERQIEADISEAFAPRQGPHPTQGYSALMPPIPMESVGYSRMAKYETNDKGITATAHEIQCSAVDFKGEVSSKYGFEEKSRDTQVGHSNKVEPLPSTYIITKDKMDISGHISDAIPSYLQVINSDEKDQPVETSDDFEQVPSLYLTTMI